MLRPSFRFKRTEDHDRRCISLLLQRLFWIQPLTPRNAAVGHESLCRPGRPLLRGSSPASHPVERQLPDQSTIIWLESSSTDDSPLRGALPSTDIPPFHSTRTKVEVPSALLLTTSSFGLNASIVLVVDLFRTRSSSALAMFNVIDLPLIAQVPSIVPVTPWPSVLLMKPCGRKWDTKVPFALNDMVSFMSPTVPIQSPIIFVEYSASLTDATFGEHDAVNRANETRQVIFTIFPNTDAPLIAANI